MDQPEPIWHFTLPSSIAGGILYAFAQLVTVIFAPKPPNQRELWRVFIEGTLAIASAGIGGYCIAPALCQYLHVTDRETIFALGTLFGVGFWRTIPVTVDGIVALTARQLKIKPPAEDELKVD